MKKNGFTLVELLAVVSILSLLLLLVAPKIVNQLNNSKKDVNDVTKKIIYNATEKYLKDFNIAIEYYEIKCIPVEELMEEKYLSNSVTNNETGLDLKENKSVKVTNDKDFGYGYELISKKVCNEEQGMLSKGLIPVAYDGDNWVVVSSTNKNNEWYDYDNQKWANAVVLKQNSTKTVGDTVTVEGNDPDVLMMYVWIPRYEYKIEGDYGKDGTSTTNPGEIEVNFIGKNKTTATAGYRIHPAFTFGDKEESGFWVGKFELSHSDSTKSTTSLGCNTTSCTNAQNLRILPNVPSLRSNNVSNFWYGIKSIENTNSFGLTNIDIHMMKNSEWGAVAYLSQSKYGKYGNKDYEGTQKEVYINNSSGCYTGRSGGNVGGSNPINGTYTDQTSTTQDNTYGFYTYDGYLLSYNTNTKTETRDINKGAGASTTGNIYGVYDMSGGSLEYVMGAYGTDIDGIYSGNSTSSNSGFNGKTGDDNETVTTGVALPETKYYDMYANATNYSNNDGKLSCKNGNEYGICYGHSISETSNWYGDVARMVYKNYPWFLRGGHCFVNAAAGVFARDYSNGVRVSTISARVVGFGK